jgi:hypothetical protein
MLSQSDLFQLSLWLSAGVAHLPHYPLCIYTRVFCLSVLVCLVCSSQPVFCVSGPAFYSLSFIALPGLDPCLACPDSEPACLATLPVPEPACWPVPLPPSGLPTSDLTQTLPAVRYRWPTSGLLTPACLDLSIACPCWNMKLLFIRRSLHLGLPFIPDTCSGNNTDVWADIVIGWGWRCTEISMSWNMDWMH